MPTIVLNLLIETIWSPCLREEWYGDSLSVAVKLQSTNSDCIHDRCIVDHLHFNPHGLGTNNQIGMRSCPGNLIRIKYRERNFHHTTKNNLTPVSGYDIWMKSMTLITLSKFHVCLM